jgi:hypothetical protein
MSVELTGLLFPDPIVLPHSDTGRTYFEHMKLPGSSLFPMSVSDCVQLTTSMFVVGRRRVLSALFYRFL